MAIKKKLYVLILSIEMKVRPSDDKIEYPIGIDVFTSSAKTDDFIR